MMLSLRYLLLSAWCLHLGGAMPLRLAHLFEEDLPPIPSDITVGAYYYPWYYDDFHRNDGYMREHLQPPQHPQLGEYNDRDPAVLAQHLAWSRQANINLWVCSWWGPETREDKTIRHSILNPDVLTLGSFKIALHFETTGSIRRFDDERNEISDTSQVRPDMEHMCEHYFQHPNYYRIRGRPVVVVYLTRLWARKTNSGGTNVLEELVTIMRTVANECGEDIYIIGDHIWNTDWNHYPEAFVLLDAITNFDVYGHFDAEPYATETEVDDFFDEQQGWVTAASGNASFVPGVAPGYNDKGVRLNNPSLSRRMIDGSIVQEEGSLFVAALQKARYMVDPEADNLILVNSFNEWHEDTQIEPATTIDVCDIQETSASLSYEPGSPYSEGLMYQAYGDLYLNILHKATYTTRSVDHLFPAQSEPRHIVQADVMVGAYYYPWHTNDFHNSQGYIRDMLQPRQQPTFPDYELGEYDDNDPTVLAKHLEWSRQANIGLWVTSWWGPNSQEDDTIRDHILTLDPDLLGDHKIAMLYETRARTDSFSNVANVGTDVTYLCTQYWDHPNYYYIDGKPVLVVYLTRALQGAGLLQQAIEAMRNAASACGKDVFIIGDHVWGAYNSNGVDLLDAITNFDVYGNLGAGPHADQSELDAYFTEQESWQSGAAGQSAFVPSITPGFTRRVQNSNNVPLSRRMEPGGEEGSLFAEMITRATTMLDSSASNLLMVNSFNNFHEDTQIEPVMLAPEGTGNGTTSLPSVLTSGLEYEAYGDLYLNILSVGTKRSQVRTEPVPVIEQLLFDDFSVGDRENKLESKHFMLGKDAKFKDDRVKLKGYDAKPKSYMKTKNPLLVQEYDRLSFSMTLAEDGMEANSDAVQVWISDDNGTLLTLGHVFGSADFPDVGGALTTVEFEFDVASWGSVFFEVRSDADNKKDHIFVHSVSITGVTASTETLSPSQQPSMCPTTAPTQEPTEVPSSSPTPSPSRKPSSAPSNSPSFRPSIEPSVALSPSQKPSATPSIALTLTPTSTPTLTPPVTTARTDLLVDEDFESSPYSLVLSGNKIKVDTKKGYSGSSSIKLEVKSLADPPKLCYDESVTEYKRLDVEFAFMPTKTRPADGVTVQCVGCLDANDSPGVVSHDWLGYAKKKWALAAATFDVEGVASVQICIKSFSSLKFHVDEISVYGSTGDSFVV